MKVVSDTVKSFYKELGVKTVTTLNCPQENESDITTTTNPEKDPFEEVLENSDFANDNLEQKSKEDEIEFITSDTLENDEKVSYSDILIEVLDNNRNAATKNFDLQDQVVQNGDFESKNFEEKSRDGSPKVLENGLTNGQSMLELQNVKPVQNGTAALTFSSDDISEDKTNTGAQILREINVGKFRISNANIFDNFNTKIPSNQISQPLELPKWLLLRL